MRILASMCIALLALPVSSYAVNLGETLNKVNEGITEAKSVIKPAASQSTANNDLVSAAMSQLNLSKPQAEGGLGTLFSVAKSNLSNDQFSQLSSAVPNMGSLLSAVPGGGSGVGGIVSSLAKSSAVTEQLAAFGISPEMVGPLVDIVAQYLGQNAEAGLSALFSKGVSGLLGQ